VGRAWGSGNRFGLGSGFISSSTKPLMRNIFDQYTHPENRLTHALMASLDADRRLLREFIRWVPCRSRPSRKLVVLEQSLPGELVDGWSLGEEESRGLPDGWIYDDDGWALLIESKIAARADPQQIRRHLNMAKTRGASDVTVLWLTVMPVPHSLGRNVVSKTWAELYEWLTSSARSSEWAIRAAQYFEVAEVQADMKADIKEGTLTRFAGIPFGDDTPYNYPQAKRILGLLRARLAKRRDLKSRLRSDPSHAGRGAIKGTRGLSVWDFVALRDLAGSHMFTQHPHLTIGIGSTRLEAFVTFPNNLRSRLRTQLLGKHYEFFATMVEKTTNQIVRSLRPYEGAIPAIILVQRRYPSMNSVPIRDADMNFDPRTAFRPKGKRSNGAIRYQPEWLRASYEALRHRHSNLQFQIGAIFPHDKCPATQKASIENAVAATWIACQPLIQAARES
jgi:hypothetical protein